MLASAILLFILHTAAQQLPLELNVATQIYPNVPGAGAVAIASIGSPNVCSSTLFLLTHDGNFTSPSHCVATIASNGTVLATSCDPAFAGATSVVCSTTLCFVLNPLLQTIVAINSTLTQVATIRRVIGIRGLTNPTQLSVVPRNTTHTLLVVADFLDTFTSVWFLDIRTADATLSSSQIVVNITNDNRPAGIFCKGTAFMVAFESTPDILVYNFTGRFNGTFGQPFGDVALAVNDYYDRVFVSDPSCNCVKVLNTSGVWVNTINVGTNSPQFIATTRNYIYLVDSLGVTQYSNPILRVDFKYTNVTCRARGGSISLNTTGGAYPLSIKLYPDQLRQTATAILNYYDYAWNGLAIAKQYYPWTIFGDKLAWETTQVPSASLIMNVSIVNNTTPPPPLGSIAYAIMFGRGSYFGFSCGNCVDNTRFSTFEVYINPGFGGQTIELALGVKKRINPGDYPLNTWSKISIDITDGSIFGSIIFTEVAGTPNSNLFYIAYINLQPYSRKRVVKVTDYCGVAVTSDEINVVEDNPMTVEVQTVPPSCNPAGYNRDLSINGYATAIVRNGVPPFRYNWSISSSNEDTLRGLAEVRSNIIVYKNSLNTSFVDISYAAGRIYQDSTRYYSAPYSFSMAPNVDLQSFTFSSPQLLFGTQYPKITFWVNGGDTGGQRVSFVLQKYAFSIQTALILDLIKMNSIPPNVWVQATYNVLASVSFTACSLQASGDKQMDRIYFDDLEIHSRDMALAYDSTGCLATTDHFVLTPPPVLSAAMSVTNLKCYNISDGIATVNISGGTGPYLYEWAIGDSEYADSFTTSFTKLRESQVTLDVSDALGCTLPRINVAVLQPPRLMISEKITPILCYGGTTRVEIQAKGGVGPYTYTWASNTPIMEILPQPSPLPLYTDQFMQSYSVARGIAESYCVGTGSSLGLSFPPTLSGFCSLNVSLGPEALDIVLAPACISCLNSMKFVRFAFWIFVERAEDFDHLALGVSTTISTFSAFVPLSSLIPSISPSTWTQIYFNLTEESDVAPTITITTDSPTDMGMILLDDLVLIPKDATNVGFSAYSGFKSNVQGASSKYFLTIVDANGCSLLREFNIQQPAGLSLSLQVRPPSSVDSPDGRVDANVTGGTPPYSYWWADVNDTTPYLDRVRVGEYTVQVMDANGCSTESSVLVSPTERLKLMPFNTKLATGLSAFVIFGLLVFCFAAFMLIFRWKMFSKQTLFYSVALSLGVLISFGAAISVLMEPSTLSCQAFPILLGVAFILVFGCLFIKTWALYKIWLSATKFERTTMTPLYIVKVLGLWLIIEVLYLVIWMQIDPPKVIEKRMLNSTLEKQCECDSPTFWILFLSAKALWLIFGSVLAILTRNISKEYNESANIAYAIYNNTLLATIAIPLSILLQEVPGGRMVIQIVLVVTAFTFTLGIMFFPFWQRVFLPKALEISASFSSESNVAAE